MNQPTPTTIEVLAAYSSEDAAMMGSLLPYLSDKFDGAPLDEGLLRDIISSPHHDQLVARNTDGAIVGMATVSVVLGAGVTRGAYLEDFVVHPDTQGMGVGGALWEAIISWCQEKGAKKLDFTSSPSKEAAQRFYLKHGAVVRDTNHFRKTIE